MCSRKNGEKIYLNKLLYIFRRLYNIINQVCKEFIKKEEEKFKLSVRVFKRTKRRNIETKFRLKLLCL